MTTSTFILDNYGNPSILDIQVRENYVEIIYKESLLNNITPQLLPSHRVRKDRYEVINGKIIFQKATYGIFKESYIVPETYYFDI